MDALNDLVTNVSDIVWNVLLLWLLVGTGIFYSIRTHFVQVRHFGRAMKRVFGDMNLKGEKAGADGMSSFQALATAIAAQVGTGNIAGCATALVSGGPGAIFWMWLAAFFGMATIYGEATLAQKTKTKDEDGNVIGGPVYYITTAFKGRLGKFLAVFFAIAIILALGIMGIMVQSNSISDAFNTALGIPTWIVGLIVAAVAGFIFIGGISRIASVTEKVVPIMAAIYIVGGIIVLIINAQNLPGAIASIFIGAFSPQALGGAVAGKTVQMAVRYGVARGLFSNEAGMGSTPHSHAIAKVKRPQDQGEVAMVGVFIDTFIVLTLTALVILSSGVLDQCITDGITGTAVAQEAFSNAFGGFGYIYVAICLMFFAFSTIVGWYFFAAQNVKWLIGKKVVKAFAVIVVIFIFIGSLLKVDLVWNLADLFNGLMVFPNLLALLALSGVVAKLSKEADLEDEKK
ncbi:MAG: alanine/glycine:cation symporter family protein [Atopobiaceae bacterium]|jgi:AGCS family alanine or glycine:cation symporter